MTTAKPNEAQMRLMRILAYLANDVANGLAPVEIAQALQINPVYVTRDLQAAELAQFAIRNPQTARWSPGPALIEIAVKGLANIQRHRQKLDDLALQYMPRQ